MQAKTESRAKRWADAAAVLSDSLDAMETAWSDCKAALDDLDGLKSEYQDWLDNLPDSLRGSPVGEKLEAIVAIEFDADMDFSDVQTAAQEAADADLPQGWGRD
jgi:hypothetical protein